MLEYECPRCGFLTAKHSNYINHTKRKIMCQARDPSRERVVPTEHNVIRRTEQRAPQPSVQVVGNTINNINHINTTNNTTFNIRAAVAMTQHDKRSMLRFPRQDLSHLSDQYKRAILQTVSSNGSTRQSARCSARCTATPCIRTT
jgi:hypothetical protein